MGLWIGRRFWGSFVGASAPVGMAMAVAMLATVTPCGLQTVSLTRKVRKLPVSVHPRPCAAFRGYFAGMSEVSSSPAALRRRELFGVSLKGLVASNVVRASAPEAVSCVLEEASPAKTEEYPPTKIWMSDVVVRKPRNYFKNREWTAKDLTYAGFMAFMHGLCLFAPTTFSWNAFGVFVGLYIITGMLGITLSYHRNLSHKSFKVPKWLEYTFAYCGVQAIQVILETVSADHF